MTMAGKKIYSFLIIMQNANMATSGKVNCRLNPNKWKSWSQHGNKMFCHVIVVSLIVDITGNLDEIISSL